MMTELHLASAASHDPGDPLSLEQNETLQSAVAKVVVLGAQVGFSADQLIQLLRSGLTVGELLEVLATRTGEDA